MKFIRSGCSVDVHQCSAELRPRSGPCRAGSSALDVHQDQHAVALTLPMPVMKLASTLAFISGAGLICVGAEFEHVATPSRPRRRHAARTFSTITTVKLLYSAVSQAELQAQVDDRHDHAAQVDHALDERGRVGDARGLLVGADLLNLQDVDAVFLGAEAEGQEFAAGGNGCARRLRGGPPGRRRATCSWSAFRDALLVISAGRRGLRSVLAAQRCCGWRIRRFPSRR